MVIYFSLGKYSLVFMGDKPGADRLDKSIFSFSFDGDIAKNKY